PSTQVSTRTCITLSRLVQLSRCNVRPKADRMVGLGGFEPPTSPLSGVRSNQLSYKPVRAGLAGRSLKTKQRDSLMAGALKLLRKEVIQPHLPIRLPCYDFTPITGPTFAGSLPCGLGHRLRVLPAFVV